MDASDNICVPSVTLRAPPRSAAKWTLLVPVSARAKYTPLPSGAHSRPPGSRSYVVRARIPVPSMPATHTSFALYDQVPYARPRNATERPSGETSGFDHRPLVVTSWRTAPVATSSVYTYDSR